MRYYKTHKLITLGLSACLVICLIFLSGTCLASEKTSSKLDLQVTLPEGTRVSEKIFSLNGLPNAGRVSPVIYRGAQPLQEGYETLKSMGIKTVINLRNHSEKKEVEAAGMRSIEVPLSVLRDVDIKVIDKIIDMMTDPANQPVYVHCRQGQDRTGIVIAAYRMKVEGWSLKEAGAEMQAFGFNDIWHELKEFVRKYAKSLEK